MNLIDRDAIITREGLIFRVLGYSHPEDAYFCDLEYAPSSVFQSSNPKAPRGEANCTHYKLYEDEAWKYLRERYPKYLMRHEQLGEQVIGVKRPEVSEVRKPDEMLKRLAKRKPKDSLVGSVMRLANLTTETIGVDRNCLGVFGSVLHGFHHPGYSDIDLVVYGRKNVKRVLSGLARMYQAQNSMLSNEFDDERSVFSKDWKFLNYSREEYLRHQRGKVIYALFKDAERRTTIKTEFEPVKDRTEAANDYDPHTRIKQIGWVKMIAEVTCDEDSAFLPSCYGVEPIEILEGRKEAVDVERVVSFMEEFRLQARKGDKVLIEGNLENLLAPLTRQRFQVALTYCPRYYEQVLKRC